MYAIDHGNIYHQYTPVLLAFVYHTWILWVYIYIDIVQQTNKHEVATANDVPTDL